MNKYIWIVILLALALPACSPAAGPTSKPTPGVVDLTIGFQKAPTQAAQPAVAPQPTQAQAATASLDGLVWNDLDRNGIQSLNEAGVPNVAVTLITAAGNVAGTATTDSNGAYHFQDLTPGAYFVTLLPPPGFVFSPQDQGQNDLVDSDTDPQTTQTVPVPLVPGENGLVFTTGIYSPTATISPEPGTVRPPADNIYVCAAGTYSLGGIATLQVNQLAPDYCLHAFLWNNAFAIGRIPGGAGRILSDVTFLEIYYQNTFTYQYDVPGQTKSIQVCYAVPNGMQAQIYFFDHYGPRFGHPHQGQPSWEPLETTIQNGIACAVAQTSGAYALIGK